MTADVGWDISTDAREKNVARAASGLSATLFARGEAVKPCLILAAAQEGERRAYDRARVEARTTTGVRPKAETEKAYLRILSQCILDHVKNGLGEGEQQSAESTSNDGRIDLSVSGREFMTADLAQKLLEPVLRPGASIHSLKLSTKSIGLDAAPVVVSAINNVTNSLKHADMSDIIAGRPEVEVLQVLEQLSTSLSKCPGLTYLDISDNALGEKGIRACQSVLSSSPNLQSLYLKNIGCSVNACKAVAELVGSSSLKLLHLFNNMSDNKGATAIASLLEKNTTMEDFRMVSSRVGLEGGASLCIALAQGSALHSLDLSDNPMEPGIGKSIGSLLPLHEPLRNLVLNDICLGDEGVTLLSDALVKSCPSLERLELSLNEITSSSTPSLARALVSKRSTLRILVLAENELECAGAVHISAAVTGARALEELNLATNMIGRVGAVQVVQACFGAPKLHILDLSDNSISEDGIEEITRANDTRLKATRINLEDNNPDDDPEEDSMLEDALADVQDLEIDISKLSI